MGNANPALAQKRIDLVRRRITSCTSCELHLYCQSPVPPITPATHVTPELLIVGEAPGQQEDKEGRPFFGPAGKLIWKLLRQELGVHEKQVLVTNAVSCRPTVANHMKMNRQPSKQELFACRDNLAAVIDLYVTLGGRYVLLLGATALGAIVEGAKITQWSGRPFVITHRKGLLDCVATFHPAAALRDVRHEPRIREHLGRLKQMRAGWWPEECVLCKGDVARYDAMGIGWCEEHRVWGKGVCRAPEMRGKQLQLV